MALQPAVKPRRIGWHRRAYFHPGVFWRQNAGKVQTAKGHWIELGPEGIADIVGFLPGGQIVFVETKTRKGKQRESQKQFQAAVEAAGAIYVLARSGEEAVNGVSSSEVDMKPKCRHICKNGQ